MKKIVVLIGVLMVAFHAFASSSYRTAESFSVIIPETNARAVVSLPLTSNEIDQINNLSQNGGSADVLSNNTSSQGVAGRGVPPIPMEMDREAAKEKYRPKSAVPSGFPSSVHQINVLLPFIPAGRYILSSGIVVIVN